VQQRMALEIGRKIPKDSIICAATGNLGKVYMQQGLVDEATTMFESAHALSLPGSRSRVVQAINVSQVLANPKPKPSGTRYQREAGLIKVRPSDQGLSGSGIEWGLKGPPQPHEAGLIKVPLSPTRSLAIQFVPFSPHSPLCS